MQVTVNLESLTIEAMVSICSYAIKLNTIQVGFHAECHKGLFLYMHAFSHVAIILVKLFLFLKVDL